MGYNLTYIDDHRLGVVIGETDDFMPCPSNYIGKQIIACAQRATNESDGHSLAQQMNLHCIV